MFRPLRLRARVLAAFFTLVGFCGRGTPVFAQSTTAPPSEECSDYVSIALPAEAEQAPVPKTPPSCASYRSYRGLDRPVNYAEARACAWQERRAQQAELGQNLKEPLAFVVGGSLILADMYFNGAGVTRNVPLAMRLACESDDTMARAAARDLAGLDNPREKHGPFEFCDHAWTTFTASFCTGYQSEIEDARRNRYFNALKSTMNTKQRTAFDKLLSARDAYIDAHASEVYQGGTIHNIRTANSQTILKNLFKTEVTRFERKEWPTLSRQELRLADVWLNREYERKLGLSHPHTDDEARDGVVTREGLVSVEATWLVYRDAWVTFARLRYPAVVNRIRSAITLDRYRLVKTIDAIW